ncbi:MAG: hypothetical protein DRI44_01000 [Chlamydiae bacterium]|nr:MAG: hypothetical protein DRI44_01000 [Chlamydiota bacterium]
MNNNFDISFLIGGFITGLSVGALCLSTCSCLLLPLFLSKRQNVLKTFFVFLNFSCGRFLSYVAFGVITGWLGSKISSFQLFEWIIPSSYLIAAMLLLNYINKSTHVCTLEKKTSKKSVPFFLGITTGLNFCPPFVLAAAVTIQTKSPFWGGAYFFAFFLGTSVYLFPLVFAGALTRWGFWRKMGRIAGIIVGFTYIFIALSTFHSLLYSRKFIDAKTIAGPAYKNLKLVDTRKLNVKSHGYAGETPVIIAFDNSGIISNIFLLENNESKYVVNPISKWLEQWKNNSAEFLLKNVESVDGISGATMTIDSLRKNLKAAASRFSVLKSKNDNQLRTADHGLRITYRFVKTVIPFVILFIIAVVVTKIPCLQKLWLQFCLWILAVVILGFYHTTFFSIEQVSLLIHGKFPPISNLSWYVVFFMTIISPLFFGRAYCKYVCPFGALTEICYRVIPGSLQLPKGIVKYLRFVKYILLFTVIILMVVFSKVPADKFEPFHSIFTKNQTKSYFIFGLSVLIVSCFIKRFWCNYFCVDGALFEMISIAQSRKAAKKNSNKKQQ